MKRISYIAVSALAAATAASQAQAETIAFRPGFYAGGFAGWVSTQSKPSEELTVSQVEPIDGGTLNTNTTTPGGFTSHTDADAFTGGALIGYSVIGAGMFAAIEADLAINGKEATYERPGRSEHVHNQLYTCPERNRCHRYHDRIHWHDDDVVPLQVGQLDPPPGRHRNRLRYAHLRDGRSWRWAVSSTRPISTLPRTSTVAGATSVAQRISEKWQLGWTLGGGLDIALWGPWSARVEYRYVDLGTGKLNVQFADGSVQTIKFNDTEQTVRFGLVYAF